MVIVLLRRALADDLYVSSLHRPCQVSALEAEKFPLFSLLLPWLFLFPRCGGPGKKTARDHGGDSSLPGLSLPPFFDWFSLPPLTKKVFLLSQGLVAPFPRTFPLALKEKLKPFPPNRERSLGLLRYLDTQFPFPSSPYIQFSLRLFVLTWFFRSLSSINLHHLKLIFFSFLSTGSVLDAWRLLFNPFRFSKACRTMLLLPPLVLLILCLPFYPLLLLFKWIQYT